MPDWRIVAVVAAGGALGSVARYGLSGLLTRGVFPWGTVAVNVVGSFLLAIIVFSELARGSLSPEARMFATVGILGGFTTMSTFSVELLGLMADGSRFDAGLYWGLNAIATIGAAVAGRAVAIAAG